MIRRAAVALAVVLLGGTAFGQPQQEIVLAVFVPSTVFASAQARSDLAQSMATQLGARLGRPARGVAFARARDLETAVARGEIHVAVLDPLYVAGRGTAKLLATARRGGASEAPAIGLTKLPGQGLPALRGKRLILPSAGGAETRFVENFVLEGEIPARQFWGSIGSAPDGASAIAAVAGDQADVTIVLDSPAARALAAQRGLRVAFTTRGVPGPALAWVKAGGDAAQQNAVASAVSGLGAGVLGDGWGAAQNYRGILAPPVMPKPLFGAPQPIPLRAGDAVQTPASDFALPAWTPVLVASPARLR
jgi:phosphonate ABC transporter substrate-binding protein